MRTLGPEAPLPSFQEQPFLIQVGEDKEARAPFTPKSWTFNIPFVLHKILPNPFTFLNYPTTQHVGSGISVRNVLYLATNNRKPNQDKFENIGISFLHVTRSLHCHKVAAASPSTVSTF